jgi:hypothetical protein
VPDLTIEYVQICALDGLSEDVPSSKGDRTYHVVVTNDETMDSCECDGFMFRRKCRHVAQLREKLCGWSAQYSDEVQTPQQEMEAKCPRCGGDTRTIRVGV